MPGTQERFPNIGRRFLDQQNFHASAGAGLLAVQAGRDHARIVHHQQVGWMEKRRKVGHPPVIEYAAGALDNHHPGLGAVGSRLLGNQFRRQIIEKIGGFHRLGRERQQL